MLLVRSCLDCINPSMATWVAGRSAPLRIQNPNCHGTRQSSLMHRGLLERLAASLQEFIESPVCIKCCMRLGIKRSTSDIPPWMPLAGRAGTKAAVELLRLPMPSTAQRFQVLG